MSKIKVSDVKEKFPNPMTFHKPYDSNTAYCVGGALCGFLASRSTPSLWFSRFPNIGQLCEALLMANPELPKDIASRFADDILDANDSEDKDGIRKAWDLLDEALYYFRDDAAFES